MTEPKWTPGPWDVGGYTRRFISAENGMHVAEALMYGVPIEQQLANARLIAAAPELYAALAAVRKGVISGFDTVKTIRAIDAALAKARGE